MQGLSRAGARIAWGVKALARSIHRLAHTAHFGPVLFAFLLLALTALVAKLGGGTRGLPLPQVTWAWPSLRLPVGISWSTAAAALGVVVLGALALVLGRPVAKHKSSMRLGGRKGWSLPRLPGLPTIRLAMPRVTLPALNVTTRRAAAGIAAIALAGGLAVTWMGGLRLPQVAFVTGPGASVIEGRGVGISGDTFRLKSQVVRLTRIEAPEREQQCQKSGRGGRWSCGASAAQALAELLAAGAVRCSVDSRDAEDKVSATCQTVARESRRKPDSAGEAGKDIAAQLVAEGHVFAAGGWLARYGTQERAAKQQRLGLWAGEAERPGVYRAKIWEEAKTSAPSGCPIKGHVTNRGKIYMLPWSPEYANARVRTSRGERWFCTEAEAQAAGFRPSSQS